MKINKTTLDNFREDFKEAVKSLEEKYGVVVKLSKICYDEDSFSGKIEVSNGSDVDEVEKKKFEKDCWAFHLMKEDYGRTISFDGQTLKIVGLDSSRRKYPVVVENVRTGKKSLASIGMVLEELKKDKTRVEYDNNPYADIKLVDVGASKEGLR